MSFTDKLRIARSVSPSKTYHPLVKSSIEKHILRAPFNKQWSVVVLINKQDERDIQNIIEMLIQDTTIIPEGFSLESISPLYYPDQAFIHIIVEEIVFNSYNRV